MFGNFVVRTQNEYIQEDLMHVIDYMFKFVHISDFHLNKSNLEDWTSYVKKAFIEILKSEFNDGEAVIFCTGDLLDKGGVGFGSIVDGFKQFKEAVIDPVIKELQIPVNQFVIIPGNHDVQRNADDEIAIGGLINHVSTKSMVEVNNYVKSMDFDTPRYSKRVVPFKQFEKDLYTGCSDVNITFRGSAFKLSIGAHKVGISAFNTVWNCSDNNDRSNGICISEFQYNECTKFTDGCDLRIALMHHPLDWLDKEKDSIQSWIKRDYDILLNGHVHSSDTTITTKSYGSIFIDTAPALENEIRNTDNIGAFANGIKVIEIDEDKTLITLKECRYNHKTRAYIASEPDTFNYVSYSSEEEKVVAKCTDYIIKKHYVEYDNSIIPHKADAIKTLKDAFVLPPIEKNGDDKDTEYTLSDILSNKSNIVLYGGHESGKTTLLYRMIMELLDNHNIFQTIPAYIDFNSIGNRDIDTCLKSYLDCNSSELKTLLRGGFITLFLDNYSPNRNNKQLCGKIEQFIKYNDVKVIATHDSELKGTIDTEFANNNPLAFETYYIKPFNAANIRQLIVSWTPGVNFEETNTKLQSMVSNFKSYSLPCSAMSVSLYLWSTESTNKKPVNPALLLDIFLEILLEKMNPQYLYRDSFDYENKVMLLADMSKKLHNELEKNLEYKLTYAQYLSWITEYIHAVGFEKVEADRVGDYFIEQKLFVKQGDYINFTHTCFYHFLLAKRMVRDEEFRNFVLSDAQYYKYERVIDYYAGLTRSDRKLLEEMLHRFNDFFAPLDAVSKEISKDMDEYFTFIRQGEIFTPAINKVALKRAVAAKGTQQDVEKRINKVFDEKLNQIVENYTKPSTIFPEEMIVMLAKMIRNMDGVMDVKLKEEAYTALVKKSLTYTFILKDILAKYANEHSGELPPSFSDIRNIPIFFRYMPYSLQCSLHEIMGSTKLFTPIKEKIKKDGKEKGISDIERYFSIAMLWDSTGLENEKDLRKLIKSVGNNCVQDYILNKVYYRFKNLVPIGNEEEENKCISLLADLKVKGRKLGLFEKGRIMADIKKERENYFHQFE